MSIISVPFHQDERLPEGAIPLPSAAMTVAPELSGESFWRRFGVLCSAVASAVAAEVRAGSRPTVVSGDCLVSLGVVAGVQRSGLEPSVVWFDAHGDVHTVASSTSGYWGGLALRMVVGGDCSLVAEQLGLRPVPESRVTLVDARDLDPAEATYLATSEIQRCTVEDVKVPDGPLILHVDVDVIDSAEVPGLRFPVPGGPSLSAVLDAVRRVVATGDVVAVDLAFPWHATPEHEESRAELVRALVG
jgi:arginase family enzyme